MMTRIGLFLVCVLLWTTPSWAQVANVQTKTCDVASSTTPSCTFDNPVTSGNTLTAIVSVRVIQTVNAGPNDATNGAWTCPAGAHFSDGTTNVIICYFNNTASATPAVGMTLASASATYWWIAEWSGVANSTPEDGDEEGVDTATPFGVPSALTTTTAGLIVCGSASNAAISATTPATGFTGVAIVNRGYFQYRIGTATTSDCAYAATGPTSTSNAMLGLKEEAAGGGAAAPRGLLLGVYP